MQSLILFCSTQPEYKLIDTFKDTHCVNLKGFLRDQ